MTFSLVGCAEKTVVVNCAVEPPKCDFNKETDTEVISSMLECIIDQKRALEICTEKDEYGFD
jgi:hypothetical protein